MKAFILAAGHGTRLRPLTDSVPKILVPVSGIPMLDRLLAGLSHYGLRHHGLQEIALNTHHLAGTVEAHLDRLRPRYPGLTLTAIHEPELLGTGGALVNVRTFWNDTPLLVWNGDVIADLDPLELAATQAAPSQVAGSALATLAVQDRAEPSKLLVDGAGRIVGIDSPARGGWRVLTAAKGVVRALAFTGISLLAPELLPRIERPGAFDLIDALLDVIAAGGDIRAHDIGARYWGTHGSVREKEQLEQALAQRHELLARFTPKSP